jgi:tetratricopeptide (TPR) repeat protein
MKYTLLFVAAIGCYAQNVSNLSAEIQRAPTATLYADRAAAYLAAGDARGALADTDRALDKDALNVRALSLRAQANAKLGRHSAAVTDLSGAIALAPTDAALYVARSEAYATIGDQPRALADRNEALRLDPTVVAALDRKPAVVAAPEPVAVVTAPPPAREPTVITPPPPIKPRSAKQGATKAPPATVPAITPAPAASSAAPALDTSSDTSPDDHYQVAKGLLGAGKYREAIAEMTEAIAAQPNNSVFYNTRGYAYYLTKDVKKALQDYDEALKLNPSYLNATHNRALARKASGDVAGAKADQQREAALSRKK